MVEPIEENRPFYINFKNKDKTIYKVENQILYIFFRDDRGWVDVPEEMYNRQWSYIRKKGITYIPEAELNELAKKFKNGEYLILALWE